MKASLRNKLILVHLLMLVIVSLAAGTIITYELQRYYKERLFNQLKTQLDEVEYVLATTTLGIGAMDSIHDELVGFAAAARVRLTLMDSTGVVMFESGVPHDSLPFIENHLHRPEIMTAMREGVGGAERRSSTVHQRLFYAAKRIPAHTEASILRDIRYVRLAIPLAEVERVLRDLRWKIFGGGGIALLLIAAASYWISSKLTDPIQKLASVAESVKKGNLEAHFELSSHDEIGELAELLNGMLAKLREDLKQMRKLQTMRSQFLGNVSHELTTPIFAVQGYLETLLYGQVENEQVRKSFIEKAYRQAGRLNSLLTDLIDISRIESGEMKMSFRHFNLREWLARQIGELQPTAQQHNVILTLQSPPSNAPVEVLGDRDRLAQVITNLVENAIKYNFPGGKVEVGYREREEEVEVFVADTGRGIPEEHLTRIFERFYRVDKERSRAVGGTGLGLAIVKHIIEAHDSQVRVHSREGRGSRFSFTLKKMSVENAAKTRNQLITFGP